MANIFSNSLGGTNVMRSAVSDVNLARSQANMELERDRAFARKLKDAQERITAQSQAGKNPSEDKRLREVCREMEAVFLNILLRQMRDTIPERTLFPKSSGEKMIQSMLDIELTRVMAGAGGIGFGEMLYRQLSRPNVTSVISLPSPDNNLPQR
jgi:flagellar protein FlgJ